MSSKKPQPQQLQTIDPTALAQVSGGARAPTTAATIRGGEGSGSSDPVYTALAEIRDSLSNLAGQRSGGFSTSEMLLLMMVMQRGRQQQVVQSAPVWTNGNGYWIVR